MTNRRRNLGVQLRTPGGDNPLQLELVAPGPYFRGVATSGIRFVGKGGTQPYAFSIISTSSNSLPPGLSIANPLTGEVTGTPTQAGRFSFIAEVSDFASATFTRSFTIEIKAQLFWQGPPPPIGELTIPYRYQFRVLDGSGTLLTSGFTSTGTLPSGLALSAAGLLSGTPTAPAGISYFTVHATDGTDSIDIPIALEIVEKIAISYVEDRDPPNGWGGAPGSFLPSVVRGIESTFNIVVTGGVPPYSFSINPSFEPPPNGFNLIQNRRLIRGKTMDPASGLNPYLMALFATDALGANAGAQRAFFIIDSQQGRITPQHEGVDVAGGDGFTLLNFKAAPGGTVDVTNDGYVTTVEIGATVEGSVATINDVAPDSAGNLQIGGVFTDSNGDLFVPDYVREVTSASPGTIDVDNSDPQHPVLDHQVSGVAQGTYGTSSKVPRIGITDEGHVYSVSEQTITAGGAANAGAWYFGVPSGQGSDGDITLDGTNTYSFLTKVGSVYTATRNIYPNNLTINNGAQLLMNASEIVGNGELDVNGATQPAISWLGNAGGNASGGSGGAAGAQTSITGCLGNGGAGGAGAAPGNGAGNNGSAGARGASNANSNGGRGGGGLTGSGGNGAGGTGGNSGAQSSSITYVPFPFPDRNKWIITQIAAGSPTIVAIGGGTGGGGGGSGAGSGTQAAGGGGGGGGGGATGYLAFRKIKVTNGLTGVFSCKGGRGGNGTASVNNNTGGGGGGCGGGGGYLTVVYQELTGSSGAAMTIDANGGDGGTGANGVGTGTAGKGGVGGDSGNIDIFNIGTGDPASGTPAAGSSPSGTTGGAGGVCTLTLTVP